MTAEQPAVLTDESRSWIGRTVIAKPYQVTAVDIAKFAYAIGAANPIHFDEHIARSQGFDTVVAPLGYYVVIRHAAANLIPLTELAPDGGSNDLTPPSNAARRMAGMSSARFRRRILAGDVITLRKSVAEMTEKQGRSGALAFITYELDYWDAAGETVLEESYVRILR
jgi:3-methylfumaryl-CoA hydratase